MATDLVEVGDDGTMTVNYHSGQAMAMDSVATETYIIAGLQCGRFEVLLADGSRRFVADLRPGESVVSLDETTLKIKTARVLACFATGRKPTFRLTTNSGRSIVVTGDHKFFTSTPHGIEWVRCAELETGQMLAVPRALPDLGTGIYGRRWMKLLGYLLSDGGLTGGTVCFSNLNQEVLDDFASCLPAECRLVHSDRCTYRVSTVRGHFAGVQPKDRSNPVKEWVSSIGIDVLAKQKKIPEWVFKLRRDEIAPMLNTLFACDGWVDTKGIGFASASQKLVEDVAHLLLRFGIQSRRRYKVSRCGGKDFDAWSLDVADFDSLNRFASMIGITSKQSKLLALIELKKRNFRTENTKDVVPHFPKDKCYGTLARGRFPSCDGERAPEKYEMLRCHRNANVSRGAAQLIADTFGFGKALANSDIFWDRVAKIETLGEGEVFDITVEDTHNFVANDIFCHNSGKTTFLPHWLRREMIRCGPGNRGLVYLAFGPTYAVLGNKGVPEFRRIFEDITGWGRFIGSPKSRIEITKKGEQALWGHEQKEVTSIYFCYADDPSSFAGYTALGAVGDEIGQHRFKRSAYDEINARLTIARGKIAPGNAKVGMPKGLKMGRFCGGSIVYGLNWVYELRKMWVAAVQKAKAEDPQHFEQRMLTGAIHPVFHFIRFDSTMNPSFPQFEFDLAKATMEEWYFNMRYRGIFSRPAGLIYGEWDPKYERLEKQLARAKCWPIPAKWTRAAAFDPGDINFFGIFGAQQPNDKWLLYDTYSDGGEHSFRQRGKIIAEREPNLAWSVVGQISEDRWRTELRLGGLRCEPPPAKDFWLGINTSIAAMKLGQIEVVKEQMGDLIDDFGTFSRPIDETTGNVIHGAKPEDEKNRHLMAAFRYFCLKAFFGLGSSAGAMAGSGDGQSQAPLPIDPQNRTQPVSESSLVAHMARGGAIRGTARASGDRFLD